MRQPGAVGVLVLCLGIGAPGVRAGTDTPFYHWKALRDHELVRQERDFSCGLAALATLMTHYFEIPVSETELLERLDLPTTDDLARLLQSSENSAEERARLKALQEKGVSLATLAALANEMGFQAQGVGIRPELLSRLRMPAIAYVEAGGEPHFTLIRGVDAQGRVQVADSSWGNRLFSAPDFARMFTPGAQSTGRLLLVLPPAEVSGRDDWFGINRARPLLQPRVVY